VLFDLDQGVIAARRDLGDDHPAAVALVGVYHNLVRMWARL
jgi:predicted 2-oxoglutarate/Fe(II)-dependent dioxygenase YbiX